MLDEQLGRRFGEMRGVALNMLFTSCLRTKQFQHLRPEDAKCSMKSFKAPFLQHELTSERSGERATWVLLPVSNTPAQSHLPGKHFRACLPKACLGTIVLEELQWETWP